jgi:predicted acyl esterase
MSEYESVVRDGMRIDWDVPIAMDDGVALRADVFRPMAEGRYPVIMTAGPYGKWLHFDAFAVQYARLCAEHPEVLSDSSNTYQVYEMCDPEKFVPEGYVVVRIDTRGAGRSPGFLDIWSLREAKDYAICIEWAARQAWSSGKIGLSGISYLAMNQWQVAALEPPHLTAMFVFEGAYDYYRDMVRHGGILCTFSRVLYGPAILSVQHGRGPRGPRGRFTGDWVAGPETLSEEQLGANRRDWHQDCLTFGLASDEFWTSRLPDLAKIKVPLISLANWGGPGLHLRGNVEGFLGAASAQKWLEFHGLEHWTEYYTDYGVGLQKRFFAHFLKGETNGWDQEPRVRMKVRAPGKEFVDRHEDAWPIPRTQWTRLYLHPDDYGLAGAPPARDGQVTYRGLSAGVTFLTQPLEQEIEITGPIAVKLFVSSETEDADLFVVVRAFAPDFKEVTFQGHAEPHTAIAHGWLRASHRKLDPERSLPYRPYHPHDEVQKLEPGEIYELDIEVWPTCVVLPKDYRIALTVRGKDYEYPGDPVAQIGMHGAYTGVGPFRHDEASDRPPAIFDRDVTLHCGPQRQAHVLLPVIPKK